MYIACGNVKHETKSSAFTTTLSKPLPLAKSKIKHRCSLHSPYLSSLPAATLKLPKITHPPVFLLYSFCVGQCHRTNKLWAHGPDGTALPPKRAILASATSCQFDSSRQHIEPLVHGGGGVHTCKSTKHMRARLVSKSCRHR